jgi:hypothetical protein
MVLMSAELELSAWDLEAHKLWTIPVEPPWSYEVTGGTVFLDVVGARSQFPIATGGQRSR